MQYLESDLISYVLGILKESRSKRNAILRIEALLNKKRHDETECVTYTEDQMKEYEDIERKQRAKQKQAPQTPHAI